MRRVVASKLLGSAESPLRVGSVGDRIVRGWRIVRTGLCFALFGALGLTVGWVVLPARRVLLRPAAPELDAQRVIHHAYRFFVAAMGWMRVVRVHWQHAERLQRPGPLLIVANHPTLIDTPVLVTRLPQADNVVDTKWAENAFMNRAVTAAGYLRNDWGGMVVRRAVRRLLSGRTLLIYPEGTRSPSGGLGTFYRGAALTALASGCDPLPVVLTSEPPALNRERKWYQVPDGPIEITVSVGQPISLKPYVDEGGRHRPGAVEELNTHLRELFAKRLDHGGT